MFDDVVRLFLDFLANFVIQSQSGTFEHVTRMFGTFLRKEFQQSFIAIETLNFITI